MEPKFKWSFLLKLQKILLKWDSLQRKTMLFLYDEIHDSLHYIALIMIPGILRVLVQNRYFETNM
jgi:hypothetical protein